MTPDARKKLVDSFAMERNKASGVSVNPDDGVDTGTLLSGDHNEELRQADRIREQKENAQHGKTKRVTLEDVRESQRSERPAMGPPGSALFGAPKPFGSNQVAPAPGIKPGMSAADAAASQLILPPDDAGHSSLNRRRSTKSGRTPLASGSP